MNDNATHHGHASIPTSLPCPDWCGQPPGHGFDAPYFDGDDLHRAHTADVGRIDRLSRFTGEPMVDRVEVVAEETAAAPDGPVLIAGIPLIDVPDEVGSLDAGQARQFAAALTEAAELLERITS